MELEDRTPVEGRTRVDAAALGTVAAGAAVVQLDGPTAI